MNIFNKYCFIFFLIILLPTLSYASLTDELLQAINDNNKAKIKSLLEQGGPIDITDKNNVKLLQSASANGYREIVKLLLEKGIDVNAQIGSTVTALLMASSKGHAQIVNDLLEHGADATISSHGQTAVFWAVESGYTEVVKSLVNHGIDINIKNNNGRTILMIAAKEGSLEIVKLLIEKGADITAKDFGGSTAMLLAAENGHSEVVKILLENNADAKDKTLSGISALYFAAQKGYSETVQILLEGDIDNSDKNRALNVASLRGYQDTVNILLQNGAQYVKKLEYFNTEPYTDLINSVVDEQLAGQDGSREAIEIKFVFKVLINGEFSIVTKIKNKDGKILDNISKTFSVTNAPSRQEVIVSIPKLLLYRIKSADSLILSDIRVFESNKIQFLGILPEHITSSYELTEFRPPPSPNLLWCLPGFGKHAGGYEIQLRGSHLAEVTEVYFGLQKSPAVRIHNDEEISVVVPPWDGVYENVTIHTVTPWVKTSKMGVFKYYNIELQNK